MTDHLVRPHTARSSHTAPGAVLAVLLALSAAGGIASSSSDPESSAGTAQAGPSPAHPTSRNVAPAAATDTAAAAPAATPAAAAPGAHPTMSDDLRKVAANFEVVAVAKGVYAVLRKDPTGFMCDGNSALIVDDDGVVVVDAPESSHAVLTALRTITDRPVRYVVYTHWHDDHVTGGQVWRDAFPAAQFIAHPALREYLPGQGATNRKGMIEGAPRNADYFRSLLKDGRSLRGDPITGEERAAYASDVRLVDHYMAVVPGAEIVLPAITVADRLTLRRPGRTIEIRHLGRGHTASDLVVWLPEERVAITGDLIVHPVPLVGDRQSWVGDWSRTLDALIALKPAAFVPGHGPVLRDDAYPRRLAALFASIDRQTRAAAPGRTIDEARKGVDLAEFRTEFAGDSPLRRDLFDTYVIGPGVAAAYREATAAP